MIGTNSVADRVDYLHGVVKIAIQELNAARDEITDLRANLAGQ